MNGILGKIVEMQSERAGEVTIKLKPACLLPERAALPEWMNDQILAIRRQVRDPREVGGIGDSIVLTAAESERYLAPLTIEPEVCRGSFPETIEITLRWASGDKEPEYEMIAGANPTKGTFAKDGDLWRARVKTASLFDYKPSAPATVTIKAGKHEAACTLLPAKGPAHARLSLPHGPVYHLEHDWYALDISLTGGAGAVEKLVEKGRGTDHFARPSDMIHLNHEAAGHLDRVRIGSGWDWFDKLRDTPVATSGARREGEATRLALESTLDDGQQLRTSVVHTLFDRFPLLLMQREYVKGKPTEGDKKDNKPKEPVDDVMAAGVGFRTSWLVGGDKNTSSRILCADKNRLVAIRSGIINDFLMIPDWKITGGWCLMERSDCGEHMLYLFDAQDGPNLATWRGPHTMTLEPSWPLLPLTPGGSAGLTLGLAAGEICGASGTGAWIACRSARAGITRVGIIARLDEAHPNVSAEVSLGHATKTVPLTPVLIAGIGTLHTAIAEFEGAGDSLKATVAGIAQRKTQ